MPKSLPPHPTLEALKKQAKQLLAAHKVGNADACSTLRLLRRFAEATDAEILSAKLALSDAQFALAMDYGFESWAAMKRHVEAERAGPARSVTVFGQVTSAATDQPIEGVEVRVQLGPVDLDPLAYACVRTNPEGHYECGLEWNGTDRPEGRIQCRHEAYRFLYANVTERDDRSPHPKQLLPGQRRHRDFQLREGFTLELRVEDQQQVPVEGAIVRVMVDDGLTVEYRCFRDYLRGKRGLPPDHITDANGYLRIEGLLGTVPEGYQYVVEIDHDDYATCELHGVGKLPRDGVVARATVQLERGQHLTGRVIAADTGRPIEGAEVHCEYHPYGMLSNGRPRPLCRTSTTDSDGHFELSGLPEEAAGPLTVSHAVWQRTKVSFGDMSMDEPITIQMRPGHVVTGQVLDRNGRPAAEADVMALTAGVPYENCENDLRADSQGLFKLGGLPVGRRVWLVAHDGVDNYVCYGVTELGAAEDHVVLDGRDMIDVEGCVVDEEGKPVATEVACFVYAPPEESGCLLSKADAPGRLGDFRAVVPRNGTVVLALSSDNPVFRRAFFNAVSVTTHDGRLDRPLTITAAPAHELALKLIDAVDGEPVADADVQVCPVHLWAMMWGGRSAEDGSFQIWPLPPGQAKVSIMAHGYEPIASRLVVIPAQEAYVIRLEPKAQD